MKNYFHFLFFFVFTAAFSQKDHSLFWEISGNGLAKKSYLYGTMHVNEKISYRLSDAFFEHLLAADIVSNESNPESWGELLELFDEGQTGNSYKFYSEFYLSPIQREAVTSAFVSTNYFNRTLDEIEGDRADFQESTVLDMFIFQAGKKYKKKTIGLEDAKTSMLMLLKLKQEDLTPAEENKAILTKIIKNKSFTDVLKQYYREKDVVMLDSLYRLMFSKKGHQALITDRNAIMTQSLDSLAKTGSVFAGVGAAHLAGKQGILQMLRDKGYTVKPIIDQFSEAGKIKKKNIEEFFPNPNYKPTTLDDKMISLPLNPYTLYHGNEIVSPDFASGAATTIKRYPLYDYLKKEGERFDHKILDSLFFENIPGEILDKNYFETNNYRGYDIKNVTKTGNNQRYRFYITPLELIVVSMVGNGNYVRQYEAAIFDKIEINAFSPLWEKLKPHKGGFSVEIPAFHTFYGNGQDKIGNIEIQAYDDAEKGYYFLLERTLDDTGQLEETAYEHRQIHQEFYLQHSIDTLQTHFDKDGFVSESQLGNRKIRLKSVIKGPKYYLLGTVNASEKSSGRFFSSFATEPFRHAAVVKTYTDTISHFKIDIPEKPNPKLFLHLEDRTYEPQSNFTGTYRSFEFFSASGKSVYLGYNGYRKYQKLQNTDSLRIQFRKEFLHDYGAAGDYEDDEDFYTTYSLLHSQYYNKKGFSQSTWNSHIGYKPEPYVLLGEKESFDSTTNVRTIEAVVSKPKSTQAVRHKVLLRPDGCYHLKALIDKTEAKPDPFVEQTFGSIVLTQPVAPSVFDNKIKAFIADARSEKDTIRKSALRAIYTLKVDNSDFDDMAEFINSFAFKEDENSQFAFLLIKMGDIKDQRIISLMEDIYKRKTVNSEIKLSALSALAMQKNKAAYKKILELMQKDLPLSEDQFELNSLFDYLAKDPENAKILVPAVFDFYKTEEYKTPVVQFCTTLLDSGHLTAKNLGSFKKTLLNEANLKYKRLAGSSKTAFVDGEEYGYNASGELADYVNLLGQFPKDKHIDKLFHNLKTLDDAAIKYEMLRLGIVGNTLTESEIKTALDTPATRFLTLQLLLNKNGHSAVGQLTDDEIAQAAVINFNSLGDKDSVSLLQKKVVERNGKLTTYFFYRIKTAEADTEKSTAQLHTIAFVNANGRIDPRAFCSIAYDTDVADEALESKYKSIINASLNEDHYRASFTKRESIEDETITDY